MSRLGDAPRIERLDARIRRHAEWFHDHVRIDQMLLDGAKPPVEGAHRPDLGRPGHGYEFRPEDAERFAV